MTNATKNAAWLIIVLWLVVTLISFFAPQFLSANNARFINVALLSAFTFVHGAARYGLGGITSYFVIAVIVTNVTENCSIITGFPFGQYHHTEAMGPQLWHVPIIVGPIFAVAGYLSWVLAGILLRDVFSDKHNRGIARPLVAAFITTSWDFCVDAIGGTANRDWVWAEGGPWFGVPWLNFFGWMLTMWIIFQLFSFYLSRYARLRKLPADSPYFIQVIVYWTLIALQFPLLAMIVPALTFTDPAGHEWHSVHLFQSMALVSIFTMLFVSVLAYAIIVREKRDSA